MSLDSNQTLDFNNPFIYQLIKNAFDSLQDLIFIMKLENNQFLYLYANQSGQSVIGNQSFFGKSLEDLMPSNRVDFLHHFYKRCASLKKCVTFEEEIYIKDKYINYETVLTPVVNNEEVYIIAVVRDITERTKRHEELMRSNHLLEKSKQQLSTLIDNNSDAIFMIDSDGFFLETNNTMEQISGYSAFELLGRNFSQLLPRTELPKVRERFNKGIIGETQEYETSVIHKDGSEILINVKTFPIKINGKIIGLYGIARDITSIKKMLDELQSAKTQLESFINNHTDSISLTNLQGEIQFVNNAFTTTFGFTKEEVIYNQNPNIPDWLIEESNRMHERVIKGQKMQDIHLKRQTKEGVILDISMTSSPVFDENGRVTGVSSISKNITEIKKKELEMMLINNELELVWNHASDATFLLSQNGTIIKANPQFYKLFCIDEETEKLDISNLCMDYTFQQKEELLKLLRERMEAIQFETSRKSSDGIQIDILATYKPINNNKILAIVTFKDITAEKQAITKIIESEERFRNIAEHSPDPLIIHDGKIITFINKAGLKLLRAKKKDQVIGQSFLSFVHPSYHKTVIERMQNALENGQEGELLEGVLYTMQKEEINVETSLAPIREHGQTSLLVIIRDITIRRRAEDILRESEERFRVIAEHSKSVIQILSPKGKVFYISPSTEDTFGYSISNLLGQFFVDNIHRDDINKVEDTLQHIIETRESAEIEIRHLHQDGYSIWLNSYYTPILSSEGEVEKIMVISEDISKTKRKEKNLQKMAFYDYLTGLPNRRLFDERIEQAILTSQKTGNVTGLLVLDCDKFKQINDTLGHDIGDEVIKKFASRTESILYKKDTLSRVGGDEFTVVTPEVDNLEQLSSICERILNAVKEPMFIKGEFIQITISIGVSSYPNTGTLDELYKEADRNLYKSKNLGGGTYTM